MDLCPQVDRLMKAAGVSKVVELANIIGEKPNVISNWNSRKKIPSDKILKSSQIVGCLPHWLETGEGAMRAEHKQTSETETAYDRLVSLDYEATLAAMTLIDQVEETFGVKLDNKEKSTVFIKLYNRKAAGRAVSLRDIAEDLKAGGG